MLALPDRSGEVLFHLQIADDEVEPFFGSSMFDYMTRTERDSVQKVDSGMNELQTKSSIIPK
jgi:hypothetical protein